jgi:hypothetical protein
MKAIVITVVAATLAVAPVVRAQNLGEYGSLTKPSVATAGIGKSISQHTEKLATRTANATTGTNRVVASQVTNAQDKNQPGSNPTSPAVFILSNGDRLESSRYLLTADSLCVQQGQTQRTIPLSAVNLNATIAANRERGIDLKIPKNRAEITLGF